MVFTEEELRVWKVEDLKKYLSDRGVPLNTKNCRKPQLIEKVIFAEKLELPTLPSNLKLTSTGAKFYSLMACSYPFLRQLAPTGSKEVNTILTLHLMLSKNMQKQWNP